MKKLKHLVNPNSREWFHLDENYNVWSCECNKPMEEKTGVSLCLSQCAHLLKEGELRGLEREISLRKKELGMLYGNKK